MGISTGAAEAVVRMQRDGGSSAAAESVRGTFVGWQVGAPAKQPHWKPRQGTPKAATMGGAAAERTSLRSRLATAPDIPSNEPGPIGERVSGSGAETAHGMANGAKSAPGSPRPRSFWLTEVKARLDALDEWEKQLQQSQVELDKLKARLDAFKEREHKVKARLDALEEREHKVREREHKVKAGNAALEEQVKARNAAREEWEHKVKAGNAAREERKKQLQQRQVELDKKWADLLWRETRIKENEKKLHAENLELKKREEAQTAADELANSELAAGRSALPALANRVAEMTALHGADDVRTRAFIETFEILYSATKYARVTNAYGVSARSRRADFDTSE